MTLKHPKSAPTSTLEHTEVPNSCTPTHACAPAAAHAAAAAPAAAHAVRQPARGPRQCVAADHSLRAAHMWRGRCEQGVRLPQGWQGREGPRACVAAPGAARSGAAPTSRGPGMGRDERAPADAHGAAGYARTALRAPPRRGSPAPRIRCCLPCRPSTKARCPRVGTVGMPGEPVHSRTGAGGRNGEARAAWEGSGEGRTRRGEPAAASWARARRPSSAETAARGPWALLPEMH